MTIPTWPVTLPQYLEQQNYQETLPDNRLFTKMDTGPAKVRRRSSVQQSMVQGSIVLTEAEVAIFMDFWENDLAGGVLPFYKADPKDSTLATTWLVRFEEQTPTLVAEGPNFRLTFIFSRQPAAS